MAITKGQLGGLTGAIYEDMDNMGSVSISNTGAISGTVIGGAGSTITTSSGAGIGSISIRTSADEIFDRYSLNEFVVEHRVQEFEMIKLRETNVDYTSIIKDNLAKMASIEVIKKMTFTKKHEINTDTHSFRGRVWVFTKEELNQMIEDIRNGV
jgi:hypothetical protein